MRAELNRAVEKGTYAESPCEKFVTLGDRVPIVFVRGADGVDQFGREPGAHQAVVVGFGVLAIRLCSSIWPCRACSPANTNGSTNVARARSRRDLQRLR
jgi:hypothetical protein